MRGGPPGQGGGTGSCHHCLAAIWSSPPCWSSPDRCNPTHLPKAPPPPTGSKGRRPPAPRAGPPRTTGKGTGGSGTRPAGTGAPPTPAPVEPGHSNDAGNDDDGGNDDKHDRSRQHHHGGAGNKRPVQHGRPGHLCGRGPSRATGTSIRRRPAPAPDARTGAGPGLAVGLLREHYRFAHPQFLVAQLGRRDQSQPANGGLQDKPAAAWSDGTAITSGILPTTGRRSPAGPLSQTPAARLHAGRQAGYRDISNVSGSPDDPYTVTVTFSSPYPDWRSLFSYLMPAHVAEAVGFDSGFTDPVADLVSGGPYLVSQRTAWLFARARAQQPILGQPGQFGRHNLLFHRRGRSGRERAFGRGGRRGDGGGAAGNVQTIAVGAGDFGARRRQQPLRGPRFQRRGGVFARPAPPPGHHDGGGPVDHGPGRARPVRPPAGTLGKPGFSGRPAGLRG